MPYAKANSKRGRLEADRLLEVVLAHMAIHGTKDVTAYREARTRFIQTVRVLYHCVVTVGTKQSSEQAPEGRGPQASAGTEAQQ
jgi:hypothetical protein